MPRSFSIDWRRSAARPEHGRPRGRGGVARGHARRRVFRLPDPGRVGGFAGGRHRAGAPRHRRAAAGADARLRAIAAKSAVALEAGDKFLNEYFLNRQTAYSTLETDLADAAKSAGVKPRERTYAYEPIEGSETLGMVTVTANYEGTYADLVEFVYALDRSNWLLIVDSLAAQPQAGPGVLNITIKLNAFFREGGLG
ncbi:MAG: GspMb/PilO family protein [Desulfobacterales bacterium]|nr:GspMb/PilO family protein [Desulfobacterales bacterium]